MELPSKKIETLKAHIRDAIDILDNDLHATKCYNARTVLADALDIYGWPDEEDPHA